MKNPWSPPYDEASVTLGEIHRRWALFTDNHRYQFQTMAKRYAELRKDISSEAEEILSTNGEKMHVKKVLDPKLFRNWSWDSASSRQRKASTGETTSSSGNDEYAYDEDDEEAYEMIESMAFCDQRDSIEVRRESRGRRSATDDYYRWGDDENPRNSLTQSIRRVTQKLISAVQSRRASPEASKSNSPDNSDSDGDDGDNESSASESPKPKSKLMVFVQRSFSRPSKRRSQDQQRPEKHKHEPCHRSRHPNASLLKNADKPGPVAPVWSDCIGPKNERLDDLCACFRGLSPAANSDANNKKNNGITCVDSRKSIEPGHWFSGCC